MTEKEHEALVEKIYNDLKKEYGLEDIEPQKKKVYALPSSPAQMQSAMQSATTINQNYTFFFANF